MSEILLLLIIIYMLTLLLNKSRSNITQPIDEPIPTEQLLPKFSPDYENPKARFTWSKQDETFIPKDK